MALAAPAAFAGPDFTAHDHAKPEAASTGDSPIAPTDDVTFALDSDQLTPAAHEQLRIASKWLARHPEQRLVLEGHTDSLGRKSWNEDLSTRRLNSARNQLIALGVKSDRIVLVVYGEVGAQKAPNLNERRVIFYPSTQAVQQIVSESILNKHALGAVWTQGGTLYTQNGKTRA
ncbi:MAG TPA: OmpA family protein [Kofleriaceae bacterium]